MMKKLFLTIILCVALSVNCAAAQKDFGHRPFWVNLSGISTGTTNDIIYIYLGQLGYTGTINQRLKAWLIVQTGQSSSLTIDDLMYHYFVLGETGGGGAACTDCLLLVNTNNFSYVSTNLLKLHH